MKINGVNYCEIILLVFFLFSLSQNVDYKVQTYNKITERDFIEDLIVHYFMRKRTMNNFCYGSQVYSLAPLPLFLGTIRNKLSIPKND